MTKPIIICGVLVLASLAASGDGTSSAAIGNGMSVQKISPISCVLNCSQDQQRVWATVTFSNTSESTVPVFLGALLKIKLLEGTLFKVSLEGQKIPYHGILVNLGPPTPDEFQKMKPREVLTSKVDLTDYFDFSKAGKYSIQYSSISAAPNETTLIEIRSSPVSFLKN